MSEIETLRYFAQVAEKLEGIAQELAEAIRKDMPAPDDLLELECRWGTSKTKPAAIAHRGP